MVFIAILRGGDYDNEAFILIFLSFFLTLKHYQIGLPGCRITTAHRLCKYGLRNELLHAAQALSRSDLDAFLITWQEDLRAVLQNDPNGYLG